MRVRWTLFTLSLVLALFLAYVWVASYSRASDLYYARPGFAAGFHVERGILAAATTTDYPTAAPAFHFEQSWPTSTWFDTDYSFLGFGFQLKYIPFVRAPIWALIAALSGFASWLWLRRNHRKTTSAFPIESTPVPIAPLPDPPAKTAMQRPI